MLYLTYEQYLEMGGNMPEIDFTRFNLMATNTVNMNTQNRVHNDYINNVTPTYEGKLHSLMFELVETNKQISDSVTGVLVSESNQGMSKSYQSATRDELEKTKYDLCQLYLYGETDRHGTPLMYLGVC